MAAPNQRPNDRTANSANPAVVAAASKQLDKNKPFRSSQAEIISALRRAQGQDPRIQKDVSAVAAMHLTLTNELDQLPVQNILESNRERINALEDSSASTLEKRRADAALAQQFEPFIKPLEEQALQLQIERNKLTTLYQSILELINESTTLYRTLTNPTQILTTDVRNIQTAKLGAFRQPIKRKQEEFQRAYKEYRDKIIALNQETIRVTGRFNPSAIPTMYTTPTSTPQLGVGGAAPAA